jgi:hypothetical protein
MIKGIDDTNSGQGMRVSFTIYKLNHTGKKATLQSLLEDPILQGFTKLQLKNTLKFLWDWGHLTIRERIGKELIPVYDLVYPESILAYGQSRGWVTVTMEFNEPFSIKRVSKIRRCEAGVIQLSLPKTDKIKTLHITLPRDANTHDKELHFAPEFTIAAVPICIDKDASDTFTIHFKLTTEGSEHEENLDYVFEVMP